MFVFWYVCRQFSANLCFFFIKRMLTVKGHCPTKRSIKSAPYLHQKRDNWALNLVFFYTLVLVSLIKFDSNSTTRRIRSGKNCDATLAQNLMQICSKKCMICRIIWIHRSKKNIYILFLFFWLVLILFNKFNQFILIMN